MKEAYKRLATEYLSVPGVRGEADRLEFMKMERLNRIADALESISSSLESIDVNLEALSDCTTENPNGSRSMMAAVSGDIRTI